VEYSILARPSPSIPSAAFAVTDARGEFIVEGITPGSRQVVVTNAAGMALYDSFAIVVPADSPEWSCEIVAQ
jgi:hypothetical protein